MPMNTALLRSTPSAEGINGEYIINFLNACEKAAGEIHGIMIARHNKVVFEAYAQPYARNIPHILHSFTKALTNTAVGIAYSDGLLDLDDPIVKYFPEYEATANEYLRACTIRNMITMRNGQARSIGGNEWRPLKTSWKDAYFQVPFDKKPGEVYMYSSGNSYILSCIVQKLEGKTCSELVKERIGHKIGMSDFSWMLSPEGVCSGGNGVSLTAEDMLRVGILYLNKGRWNGEQLLSEKWVDYCMGYIDPIEPVAGVQYNFHWNHKADYWAAQGMFGQTCAVIPSEDMVVSITAADKNYVMMDLFQQEVVDKLRSQTASPSPEMDEVLLQKGLRMTLQGLNVSVEGHMEFPCGNMCFSAEENVDGITKVELYFTEDRRVIYVMEDARGRHEVVAGFEHWIASSTTMTGAYLHHQYEQDATLVSAEAYWSDKNVLMMEWRYPEMAFFDHLSITWKDDTVMVNRWVNMNSQALERPTLSLKQSSK